MRLLSTIAVLTLGLALAPHAAHNPSARAFADWLQAEAAEALPTSRRT